MFGYCPSFARSNPCTRPRIPVVGARPARAGAARLTRISARSARCRPRRQAQALRCRAQLDTASGQGMRVSRAGSLTTGMRAAVEKALRCKVFSFPAASSSGVSKERRRSVDELAAIAAPLPCPLAGLKRFWGRSRPRSGRRGRRGRRPNRAELHGKRAAFLAAAKRLGSGASGR